MDYPLQRQKLYEQFDEFCNYLTLTDQLLQNLKEFFTNSMKAIESEDVSEDIQKAFILLELTKNRYSCTQVIRILRQSDDNKLLADALEEINTTPGRREYSDDIEIEVTPTQIIEARGPEHSQVYPMTKKPRGKAIIINNVKNLVQRESQRFEHIFKQLLFEVELDFDLTATQITERLIKVKNDINQEFNETKYTPQALIVMIISHGSDENVYGTNACNETDKNDIAPIYDISDIFNTKEGNFEFEETFVKMFFFTCCREIEDHIRVPREMSCALKSEFDNHSDTLVFYSCAEGYQTFYEQNTNYYTFFGKCFSESIAQYAYKEDLTQIMNRTTSALRERWERIGYFSPEIRIKGLTRSVCLNPLWFDRNDQSN